ncbi:hypothetical protein D8Y22_08095 [Salinadaptatus halalkaliphilus]|uniref:Uncharacterized protein n=1 Tax=Salinadaptatus halalkaliphilus TaxID=2419781 RepID=A0A4S3TNF6_9EURY|nr:hypothetical protein [Salinadaptatus halalkaliphilus]THE65170.1 hypothetical protein D8Y22_08095 [Salinadaptatus halalkaliphilus]
MVSRRQTIALVGSGIVGVALDRSLFRPDLRVRTGSSNLHPGAEDAIDGGLDPDEAQSFVTVAPADPTTLLGQNPPSSVETTLQNAPTDDDDRFAVVVQYRSTPDQPRRLQVDEVGWRFPRTLKVVPEVDDWGSLSSLAAAERERLREAEWLVTTGVWTVSPRPRWVPSRAVLATD